MFGIIGSIVSAVSGAVSAIGSGIANLASGIASLAVSVWQGVSSFIGSLVKAFMPEAEVPEEEYDSFGYALTKLELDNYDSVAEYIRAGKEKMNNFTLEEKEEIKNFSEEEILAKTEVITQFTNQNRTYSFIEFIKDTEGIKSSLEILKNDLGKINSDIEDLKNSGNVQELKKYKGKKREKEVQKKDIFFWCLLYKVLYL